jgi:hypothetical protein
VEFLRKDNQRRKIKVSYEPEHRTITYHTSETIQYSVPRPHEMACFADTSMLLETKLPKTYGHPRSTCEPAVTYTTKNRVTKSLNTKGKLIHFLLNSFNDKTEQKSTLNRSSQLWKPISEVSIRYTVFTDSNPQKPFIILNLLCLHNCVMQAFRQQKPFNSSGAPLVHTAAILDAMLLQFNYQNDFRSLKI